MIGVLGTLISDAANVLLKTKECRKIMPESETKYSRISPPLLCNRYRTGKQNTETNEKPNQLMFGQMSE